MASGLCKHGGELARINLKVGLSRGQGSGLKAGWLWWLILQSRGNVHEYRTWFTRGCPPLCIASPGCHHASYLLSLAKSPASDCQKETVGRGTWHWMSHSPHFSCLDHHGHSCPNSQLQKAPFTWHAMCTPGLVSFNICVLVCLTPQLDSSGRPDVFINLFIHQTTQFWAQLNKYFLMNGQSRNGVIHPESQINGLFDLVRASILELYEPGSASFGICF